MAHPRPRNIGRVEKWVAVKRFRVSSEGHIEPGQDVTAWGRHRLRRWIRHGKIGPAGDPWTISKLKLAERRGYTIVEGPPDFEPAVPSWKRTGGEHPVSDLAGDESETEGGEGAETSPPKAPAVLEGTPEADATTEGDEPPEAEGSATVEPDIVAAKSSLDQGSETGGSDVTQ